MDVPTALVALSLGPAGWSQTIAEYLRAGVDPPTVLELLTAATPDKQSALVEWARAATNTAGETGITVVSWTDPVYPPQLAAIADPPAVMWARGSVQALTGIAVAIVGSRAATPYAISVAETLACDLAAAGIVVVSGLARGVDAAAHRGALAGGGSTIAVLGSGVDVIYPAEHRQLARDIEKDGLVISEFPPGAFPEPWHFPRRNRIISGLSRAVVVVEAGEQSGSLITARAALEQGRDVLAVPGSVLTGRNRGTHALLRDGARIVESAADVLDELGLTTAAAPNQSTASPSGDCVIHAMPPGEPLNLDAIAERSGLTTAKLLPRLFELELRGLVRRAGGGRFVRFDSPC